MQSNQQATTKRQPIHIIHRPETETDLYTPLQKIGMCLAVNMISVSYSDLTSLNRTPTTLNILLLILRVLSPRCTVNRDEGLSVVFFSMKTNFGGESAQGVSRHTYADKVFNQLEIGHRRGTLG